MGTFDSRYAAYEQAMQSHNYFGLKGEAIGEQFGRYATALEYDGQKITKKREGREFARQLAQERKGISMAEQSALSEGLTGTGAPSQPAVTAPVVDKPVAEANNGIKIAQKMKVGTPKTGFKFYLIDAQGNVFAVDRKTYNAAKKGKNFKVTGSPVDSSKLPKKISKEANKIKTKFAQAPKAPKVNLITDPQLYRQQRADMYEKLWGNFSHPSNTPLGTTEPTKSDGVKTWKKYFEERGKTYEKPVSGVVEADRRAEKIIKANNIKHNIEEALSKKTEFSPENLDKWSGHGRNPGLEAMGDYYRELEKRPTIETVVEKVDNVGRKVAEQGTKIDELAQTVGRQGGKFEGIARRHGEKIDGLTKMLKEQGTKMEGLTQTIEHQGATIEQLAKTNKRVLIGAFITTAVAGAVGYLLGRGSAEKDKPMEQQPVATVLPNQKKQGAIPATQNSTQTSSEKTTQQPADTTTVTPAALPVSGSTAAVNGAQQLSDSTLVNVPAQEFSENAEAANENRTAADAAGANASEKNQPFLLDPDGKYLTKKGDTFWKIAERYLEAKFQDEPEKFANLSKQRKHSMIQKECERIMRNNGYWYDEDHNMPKPMLYQKVVIETTNKTDKAA